MVRATQVTRANPNPYRPCRPAPARAMDDRRLSMYAEHLQPGWIDPLLRKLRIYKQASYQLYMRDLPE